MKYLVKGARRDTGEDVALTLEAASASKAEEQACYRGVLVASVEPGPFSSSPEPMPRDRRSSPAARTVLKVIAFGVILLIGLAEINHPQQQPMWINAVVTLLLVIVFQLDTIRAALSRVQSVALNKEIG